MFDKAKMVAKVNQLSQNSADNIIEIGLTFSEAKEHLQEIDFEDFLKETHYVEKSSMVRKWIGIGKASVRLKSVSQHLPPVFTTIYKLSTIKPDELQNLISSGILTPSVSTNEINDELHPKSKRVKKPRLILEFNPTVDSLSLKELIESIETQFASSVTIKMNDEANDSLDAANSESIPKLKAA